MDTKSSREPLITWADGALLGSKNEAGGTIYEVNLKIRYGGQLAVVKAQGPDGYYVAFTGAGGLLSLLREVRSLLDANPDKWKPDKYKEI